MDRVEHPLRLECRREEDVGEADGRVQVLAVVVVLVVVLVVLIGVVAAELDRAERVRVEGVAVAEDVVDLGVVAGVEAVLLRDVGRVEDPVDLGREAEPFERGGERDDPLGVVREAARPRALRPGNRLWFSFKRSKGGGRLPSRPGAPGP